MKKTYQKVEFSPIKVVPVEGILAGSNDGKKVRVDELKNMNAMPTIEGGENFDINF